eukprot:CAMPEP_0119321370 /NCGR_PEP_ID=MMETSP1333-20130426/55203_1 /TAXON_ID=418940 /ORGANISM="Scyphosphaera apsteinii, Strain RCC1455" /LENGTH=52 /DNA_ID=CAMNT_0007328333 /DNA_START=242 /DNA_END=400 /DNA_ORIENTATION=-
MTCGMCMPTINITTHTITARLTYDADETVAMKSTRLTLFPGLAPAIRSGALA